jgi:hypothetical protein
MAKIQKAHAQIEANKMLYKQAYSQLKHSLNQLIEKFAAAKITTTLAFDEAKLAGYTAYWAFEKAIKSLTHIVKPKLQQQLEFKIKTLADLTGWCKNLYSQLEIS